MIDVAAFNSNRSGKYNAGTINVDKPVDIEGASGGPVINGNFKVTASHVTINSFFIDGPDGSTSSHPSAIQMLGGSNETISNNNIYVGAYGYAATFNTGNTTFKNNTITYHGKNPVAGLEANSDPGNTLTFSKNTFYGTGNSNTADITVIGSTNPQTSDITVSGNTSTSGTTLVSLFNTKTATISGNTASGVSGSAVYIGGNDSGVTINGNNKLSGSGTSVNVANDFGDGANSNVTVTGNQLTSTTGAKVGTSAYSGAVDMTNNWWGNASGPTDTNGNDNSVPATNGTHGSKAVGDLKYANWCTNANCQNDTTPPLVNFTSPTEGTAVNTTDVSGTITDDTNVSQYSFHVTGPNGVSWNTGKFTPNQKSVNFSLNLCANDRLHACDESTLPQGSYHVQTLAYDGVGNDSRSEAGPDFVFDNKTPTVSFTAPNPGQAVHNLDISTTLDGTGSNIVEYGFDITGPNGINFSTFTDSSVNQPTVTLANYDLCAHARYYTCASTLPTGQYTVRAKAYDAATNRNISTHYAIDVDNTAPDGSFDLPSGYVNSPTTVKVNLTANGAAGLGEQVVTMRDTNGQLVHEWQYNVKTGATRTINGNGSAVYSYSGNDSSGTLTITFDSTGLNGAYNLRLFTHDQLGNGRSNIYGQLKLDTTNPTVTFTSPSAGSFAHNLKISADLAGTYSNLVEYGFDVSGPNGVHFSTANYQVNQASKTLTDFDLCSNAAYGSCPSTLPEGLYTVRAKAYDAAGNRNISTTLTFTIDNTAPAIQTVSLSKVTANHVTSASYNKAQNGQLKVTITTDETMDSGQFVYLLRRQHDGHNATTGRYTLHQTGAKTYVANVDLNDPALAGKTTDHLRLRFRTEDALGNHTYHYYTVDSSGNYDANGSLYYLTVDNTAPILDLAEPTTDKTVSLANGQYVTSGTANDEVNGSGVNRVVLYITDSNGQRADRFVTKNFDPNGNWTINVPQNDANLVDGQTYTFNFTAYDNANNHNKTIRHKITIDHTAPAVTANDYTGTHRKPKLTGTVDDQSATVTVTIDGQTYTASNSPTANKSGTYDWHAKVTNKLARGQTYTANVTATDTLGNASTTSATITIKQKPGGGSSIVTKNNNHVTITTSNSQSAASGNASASGNTNGGNAASGGAGNSNSAALGANVNNGNGGQVLGAQTKTPSQTGNQSKIFTKNASANNARFLGLGWWWLLILAAIAAILAFVYRVGSKNESSSSDKN